MTRYSRYAGEVCLETITILQHPYLILRHYLWTIGIAFINETSSC